MKITRASIIMIITIPTTIITPMTLMQWAAIFTAVADAVDQAFRLASAWVLVMAGGDITDTGILIHIALTGDIMIHGTILTMDGDTAIPAIGVVLTGQAITMVIGTVIMVVVITVAAIILILTPTLMELIMAHAAAVQALLTGPTVRATPPVTVGQGMITAFSRSTSRPVAAAPIAISR